MRSTESPCPRPLPPEWRLLALCTVRPPLDEARRAWAEAIDTAASRIEDWQGFERLARRHQVSGMVCDAMSTHAAARWPRETAQRILTTTKVGRMRALLQSSYLRRIATAFQHAGIAACELKGQSLSERLYGEPLLRESIDIDLLVSAADIESSIRLLETLGVRGEHSAPARAWATRQLRGHAEYHEVLRSADGVVIELHWRLKSWDEANGNVSDALGPTGALGVLPRELETVDLITHGTGHYYSRLKWLSDIRQARLSYPEADWRRIRSKAAELNALGALRTTALLVAWIFEDPDSYRLICDEQSPSWSTRRAAAYALHRLMAPDPQPRGIGNSLLKALYTLNTATPHRATGLGARFLSSTGWLNLRRNGRVPDRPAP
jgi:hypothetical protein